MPRKKRISKKTKEKDLKDQVRILLKRNEVWTGALTVFLIIAFSGSFFSNLSLPSKQKKAVVKSAHVEKKKTKSLSKIKTLADTSGYLPIENNAALSETNETVTNTPSQQPVATTTQEPSQNQESTTTNAHKDKEEKEKEEKDKEKEPKEENVVEATVSQVTDQIPPLE